MQLPRLSIRSSGAKKTLMGCAHTQTAALRPPAYRFNHPAKHRLIQGMDPDRVAATLIAPPTTPDNNTEPH